MILYQYDELKRNLEFLSCVASFIIFFWGGDSQNKKNAYHRSSKENGWDLQTISFYMICDVLLTVKYTEWLYIISFTVHKI